jgi:hypothetical protein
MEKVNFAEMLTSNLENYVHSDNFQNGLKEYLKQQETSTKPINIKEYKARWNLVIENKEIIRNELIQDYKYRLGLKCFKYENIYLNYALLTKYICNITGLWYLDYNNGWGDGSIEFLMPDKTIIRRHVELKTQSGWGVSFCRESQQKYQDLLFAIVDYQDDKIKISVYYIQDFVFKSSVYDNFKKKFVKERPKLGLQELVEARSLKPIIVDYLQL